jgi:dihydroorotate dehydrogenase electron transfer subunit
MNDGPARVLESGEMLPGVVRLLLESPGTAAAAEPGQFVQIEASAGTFPVTRRPFTINRCSGDDGTVEVVFDVVGRGTGLLASVRAGDRVRLLGPLGTGYRLTEGRWLLVGGGMGAAGFPFLGDRVDVRMTCVGASGTDRLLPGCPGEVRRATEDGSSGTAGLVTDLLDDVPWDEITDVAVCGPVPMMEAVWKRIPGELGDAVQVSTESRMGCGWGVCEGCVIPGSDGKYLKCCSDGPVLEARRIDWPGWMEVVSR